jgi:hypothetical protein
MVAPRGQPGRASRLLRAAGDTISFIVYHTFAGQLNCFTKLKALLVLHGRGNGVHKIHISTASITVIVSVTVSVSVIVSE